MSSGSEKRQRRDRVTIRFGDDELALLTEAADRAGLSVSGYARRLLVDAKPLRASRRPPIEKQLLAKTLGELGKIGSNVNQIARTLNAGGRPSSVDNALRADLRRSIADLTEMRAALLKILGREGDR